MPKLLDMLTDAGLVVDDLRGKLPISETEPVYKRDIEDIQGVVIHHTAGWRKATAKGIADWCIEKRNFPGMPYTFYIRWPDGKVDWCLPLIDIGWQCKEHNRKTFGIALAGHYGEEEPPEPMIQALTILISVLKEWFEQELQIHPHFALRKTSCPGMVWKTYIDEETK